MSWIRNLTNTYTNLDEENQKEPMDEAMSKLKKQRLKYQKGSGDQKVSEKEYNAIRKEILGIASTVEKSLVKLKSDRRVLNMRFYVRKAMDVTGLHDDDDLENHSALTSLEDLYDSLTSLLTQMKK